MKKFSKNHVIILPHAEQYRNLYNISIDEVIDTLNKPDLLEGLPDDRYTAEKMFGKKRIYIYFYQTFPLLGTPSEHYAIVDFVSFTDV